MATSMRVLEKIRAEIRARNMNLIVEKIRKTVAFRIHSLTDKVCGNLTVRGCSVSTTLNNELWTSR